ncbi:general transcription factor II-I repeat domain-containing protein 2-like [Ciona intestinalis]
MAEKKRKLDNENRQFLEKWQHSYFFVQKDQACICLVCKQAISVLKEYNLKRHYETKHLEKFKHLVGDDRIAKYKSLETSYKSQTNMFKKLSSESEATVMASYVVSYNIARRSRPFIEGEFVRDCMLQVVELLCPEQRSKFANISLSNNTVTRRIEDIGNDIDLQMNELLENFTYFSIALDESTDLSDTAQLLIFIRGITDKFEVHEELLSLQSLKGQTRGVDIFDAICSAFCHHNVDWNKLVGVTTDGAPSMVGKRSGCVALLKSKFNEITNKELITYHCIIHQEALVLKVLQMKNIMNVVIKSVNFIRSRGLNHRQFKSFLESLNSEHEDVVYFTAVRWLSTGATLSRFFHLRQEIFEFCKEKNYDIPELQENEWLCDLAFLVDITAIMNSLNLKLQGKGKLASSLIDDVRATERKLVLVRSQLLDENILNLSMCTKFADENPVARQLFFNTKYSETITRLLDEFSRRFDDFRSRSTEFQLFRNPFQCAVETMPTKFQFELIELQENTTAKDKFKSEELLTFYQNLNNDTYPVLLTHTKQIACLFGSTYLCEQTFSVMNINKSKLRTRLTDSHLGAVLRINNCTKLKPRFTKIISQKSQLHKSK